MAIQTQVLIAHTGQRLQVDTFQFSTLDDFRAWVARQSSIPVQNIVALTSQGKTVKIQNIQSETEIYVYDIRITQAPSPSSPTTLVSEAPQPNRYVASTAPNSIDDTHSLRSWQDLFKRRRGWAFKVVEDCVAMSAAADARYSELDVMLKCLDAAVANLDAALKPIEPKYSELKKWVTPAQEEYASLAANWEQYLDLARSISISPAMVRFMTGQDIRKSRQATLEDLIDPEPTRKAGKLATTSLRKFNARIADLDKAVNKMFASCDELFQEFDKLVGRSAMQHTNDCKLLLEDIEAVAGKIDSDYQAMLQYSNQVKDVPQASKTAVNHTKQLLPSVQRRASEMDDMLRYATQARNGVAADSLTFMRSIAEITSLHHNVKTQINAINQGEDEMHTFDYLRLIQQLPFMYASFTAEAVRRKDWGNKIKSDSSTLVNEMALFQDEELKRRRKWHKIVGSTYGPEKSENDVLGLEVNLLGEEQQWPNMTQQDLDAFLASIQRLNIDETIVADVAKLISELGSPTKQQSKRLKAFKNGSMHEAALGRSGLLIRGDDDLLRNLQEDKTKLEGKLKTAESRVRRLEDLLHRQSQASKLSLGGGNLFQPRQQSERTDSTISVKTPRPSGDHRRSSVASESNETLVNRIAQLEDELKVQKERSAVLEKEANAQVEHMKGQMDEANSTKQDLLGNMEALEKEFVEERRSLEEEIKNLKTRLEETEDEIEHFGESRENEKLGYDERLQTLQDENYRITKEKHDEVLKTQGQAEFLRNEARVQRERNVSIERELREARDTIKDLAKNAEASEESTRTYTQSLRELHDQLSPTEPPPHDFVDLLDAVATKSTDVLVKFQSLEQDLSLMKNDLELAQSTVKDVKSDLSHAKGKLAEEELIGLHLRESLDKEKARCHTLEAEVTEGREQLYQLRTRMSEGETGSESLRKKLEDEEKKVADLTEQVASKHSQVGSLEEEVRMFQEKLQSTESKYDILNSRFDDRNTRSKDLTQRLYTHNERLHRLLERLSFSVTRKDGSMSIQKIPRSERVSQNPNDSSDPGSSIRRSISLPSNLLADSTDLKLLYWMNAEDSASEDERYQTFMAGPGNFDIDAFSEAVYRRFKEIEHTARKMTRDARGYRERAHMSAKEAQDKIAFKQFKEGDLALFLPTRNQTTGAWAAFNVGCPHFFLREQEGHRLRSREWLVARITRIQERVVDLSKSLQSTAAAPSETETDSIHTGDENDNPFDLSDGLRWWLIDAHEDKPGAPATPGLGKSTVAANNVEAMADRKQKSRLSVNGGIEGVSRTLSKSLESRRSSTNSNKKALPFAAGTSAAKGSAQASETNSLRAVAADSPAFGSSPTSGQSTAGPSKTQGESIAARPSSSGQAAAVTTGEGDNPSEGHPPDDRSSTHPQPSPERGKAQPRTQRAPAQLRRNVSSASAGSPSKKSVVWDSLWSVDVSYPGK